VEAVASNVNLVIVCKGTNDHLTAILRTAIEVRELRSKLESRIDKERNQLLDKWPSANLGTGSDARTSGFGPVFIWSRD